MNPGVKLIVSADGSHTLLSDQYGVTYHSIHGAIDESIHVFIAGGLDFLRHLDRVRVFEMGFGTGLNVWLAAIYANRNQIPVEITTIELNPLAHTDLVKLNYTKELPCDDQENKWFDEIHNLDWEKSHQINTFCSVQKIQGDIRTAKIEGSFDLIFYDAFAPATQSYLWNDEVHKPLYDLLQPGGALVTYCAKGDFKRMLKNLGYKLDKLPGPGKKHEMTRAIK